MKKYRFLLILIYCSHSFAQVSNRTESLDKYFAGIPLRESFENWVHNVLNNPYLGVDSFSERGGYSSFKAGLKSQFPFPGATNVKILFQKTIYYDSVTNISTDSTREISIEGVFADNKMGRKESIQVFRYLTKSLKTNYKRTAIEYAGRSLSFWKGRSENFPDCSLHQGYSEELRFYYVMINYISPRKNAVRE